MAPKKKRGLGRGIEALFSDNIESRLGEDVNTNNLNFIPIEFLKPNPFQPRKVFNKESLVELAESIKDRGVLQPIIVRPAKNKKKRVANNCWRKKMESFTNGRPS